MAVQAVAPFDDKAREEFVKWASDPDTPVEAVLLAACAHAGQIRTQYADQDKHWTTEDVLDILALAVVKLRRGHTPTCSFPPFVLIHTIRGLEERLLHFQASLPERR